MNKKFALIGAAGYIAPRHMRAIKDVGGDLIAVLDPHDSVGILDKYFPNTQFFTEEHRFRRFLDKNHVNYVSICSPNYLHYGHIMLAINAGANIICEKPLVINPDNLEQLKPYDNINRIYPILQLRYHPYIQSIKNANSLSIENKHQVIIEYVTYRGPWYQYSWKGNKGKSGGLAINIGVHLFDMLIYLFGRVKKFHILRKNINKIIGNINLENANAYFNLDIKNSIVQRTIEIDGLNYDLGIAFENLHTKCYQEILAGRGLTIQDAKPALLLATEIEKLGKIE